MIVYKPIKYLRDNKTQIIEFFFMDELSLGRYTLNMKFIGTAADNGGFKPVSSMGKQVWIAATHFQRIGARRLFPCWDKPELKATFNISILHNRNSTVISNTAVQKQEIIGTLTSLTHFNTTSAMSTHLVTILVIPSDLFDIVDRTEIINIWCRKDALFYMSYAREVAKNVALYLESKFKRSEIIRNVLHVIAIPNLQDKDMMNFGVILYRESDILYHNESDAIARKIEVAHLVGRKIVHEWFSNMLNSSWYASSSWLDETLIAYSGINIINKALPNSRIIDLFVVQIQQECLHLNADYNMRPLISRINNSIEIPHYNKALVLLRMLQHAVNEMIFWNGVLKYLHIKETVMAYNGYNLETRSQYPEKVKWLLHLIKVVDIWAVQKTFPVVNVRRNYSASNINVSIHFDTSYDYFMPLTFTTEKICDFENTLPRFFLTKESSSETIELPKAYNWTIFNIQQTGYYRVNYDRINWQRILNYLDSENYAKIHILNRAQIIDDSFHFMMAKELDPIIFWNIITYLNREKDYVAWYPMFKALEYMSSIFSLQKKKVQDIKENVGKILNVLLGKLKYEENLLSNEHDLIKSLRQEAAKWACFFDNIHCQKEANRKLKQYLNNSASKTHKLLPWWREWTYCNGFKEFNNIQWAKMYIMWEDNCDHKILKFLACSKIQYVINNYFRLMKNAEFKSCIYQQAESYLINSFLFTIEKHATNNLTLTYILDNFEIIKLRRINTVAALTVLINSIYSVEQLNKVSKYITDTMIKIGNSTTDDVSSTNEQREVWENISYRVSEIREKIKLRQCEIENLIKFLDRV